MKLLLKSTELQKQRKELQKTVTKAKKSKWEWRILT